MSNRKNIPCEDHLGNHYDSLSAMLRHYELDYSAFLYRREKLGMSLEEALTAPKMNKKSTAIPCEDHLGNHFNSKVEMCDYWRIPRNVYFRRIRDGWTQKDALTTPVKPQSNKNRTVKDHLGNEYPTIDIMCEHWNISKKQYLINIRNNCSIEEALTTVTTETVCKDHLGNTYRSINEMCNHYGITKTVLRSRLELGWTLEQVLEHPEKIEFGKKVKDHLGNEFEYVKDMLEHYGVSDPVFRHRKKQGYTLEKCLSKNLRKVPCVDHLGNHFETIDDICKYWNCNSTSYVTRCEKGCDAKTALTRISSTQRVNTFGPNLTVIKQIDPDYYEVKYFDETYVWSGDQLFGYYRKHCLKNEGKDLIVSTDNTDPDKK